LLLLRGRARPVLAGFLALPVLGAAVWALIPAQTLARLATIPYQLGSGDLNQRLNIWWAGWQAFRRAPIVGSGAGTYVQAAALSQTDTAHNTALSLAVGGGLVGLSLFALVVVCAVLAVLRTRSVLRLALASVLAAWLVASTIGTVEENRTTWLLLGLMAVAGRLALACPEEVQACFPEPRPRAAQAAAELAEAG